MATKSNSASTGQAFAVIKTGGKQYKVEEGMVLKIEKLSLPAEAGAKEGGAKIVFEEVLLVDDGKETKVGVVKYMPKSRYLKKNGHRQPFTEVKIESIQ